VDKSVLDFLLVIRRRPQRKQVDDALRILSVLRLERLRDCGADLGKVKFDDLAVSLYHLIHFLHSPCFF